MIVNVTAEFNKDISRLRDKKTLLAIKESLTQIETAQSLFEMASVKKLQGAPGYYRIRIGDYRMGLYVDGVTVTVSRFLHRKEIYRYFP